MCTSFLHRLRTEKKGVAPWGFRALTTWKGETLVVRRDRKPNRCTPWIEGLEGRALLSVLTVMNNGDTGPGSLRAEVAGAAAGDVIDFSSQLDGDTITLTSGEIQPPSSVTIQGPGANLLAISGNNSSGIFDLQGVSLAISGLTLENGYSTSGSAIRVDQADQSLNASECDFKNNVAVSPTGSFDDAHGGAIASQGPVTIDQCDFTGNLAIAASGVELGSGGTDAYGGALFVAAADSQITNSHFANDRAVGGNGAYGGNSFGAQSPSCNRPVLPQPRTWRSLSPARRLTTTRRWVALPMSITLAEMRSVALSTSSTSMSCRSRSRSRTTGSTLTSCKRAQGSSAGWRKAEA